MQRLIYPNVSLFSYDPRWGELRLGADPPLYYMLKDAKFFVDLNPLGDRAMAPVERISVGKDGDVLGVESVEKGEAVEYIVSATCPFDRANIALVNRLTEIADISTGADDDKIDIHCEGGVITTCYITRVFDGDVPRSIRIVREGGRYLLVIPSPRYRSEIDSLAMNESELVIKCVDGTSLKRKLSLPKVIKDFFCAVVDELRNERSTRDE